MLLIREVLTQNPLVSVLLLTKALSQQSHPLLGVVEALQVTSPCSIAKASTSSSFGYITAILNLVAIFCFLNSMSSFFHLMHQLVAKTSCRSWYICSMCFFHQARCFLCVRARMLALYYFWELFKQFQWNYDIS